MRSGLPRHVRGLSVLVGVGTCLLGIVVLATWSTSGDYEVHGAVGADNAAPPLAALVHGHLARFVADQPVMGLVSLLVRAPAVFVATRLGAGNQIVYAVGSVVCIVPLAIIVGRLAGDGDTRRGLAAAVAGVGLVAGPASVAALHDGHPEEFLTASFAVAAVLAARAERRAWAAVLLGLAVGSKEWGLFAVPAVLIALRDGRIRALVIAGAVAAITSLPLPLLDPSAFRAADSVVGVLTATDPLSLWWPLATGSGHDLPLGLQRPEALAAAFAAFALITAAVARVRARAEGVQIRLDPLALLALIGVLRCLTDPLDGLYYMVAAIVPLAVWEVDAMRRIPWLTLLVCAVQVICVPPGVAAYDSRLATGTSTALPAAFLVAGLVLVGYLIVCTARGTATADAALTLPPAGPAMPSPAASGS